jgi:2-phosphoglycolate phosphatase
VIASRRLKAVLFDLDGTLLDTAPDMVAALNALLAEESLAPLDYRFARAHVSNGALGLLQIAFEQIDEANRDRLRDRFLEIYAARLAVATRLFAGMEAVLGNIEASGMVWGVVTNKPAYLTEPLMAALGLSQRCACLVSGDTLPHRKPRPEPLLHATKLISVGSGQAVYVGDAARDIEAGQAAGMATVAAAYGYIQPGDDPATWGADHAIEHPAHLWDILVTMTDEDA